MSYDLLGGKKDILKSPTEERTVPTYFLDKFTSNPLTITSQTAVILDSDGNDVSSTMLGAITVDTTLGLVNVVVKGGEDDKKYTLHVDVVTAEHPKLRASRSILVHEAVA